MFVKFGDWLKLEKSTTAPLCNGNGGSESSYLLRISVYVPDRRLALEQAKKSAVHAVLFKGLPANNDGCAAKVQLVNASSESENSEYFKNFFFNYSYLLVLLSFVDSFLYFSNKKN